MDIWQTGSPDRPANTGWVGRWLDATGRRPAAGGLVRPVLPPLLAGARAPGPRCRSTDVDAPAGALGAGVTALATPDPASPPSQARAAACYAAPAVGRRRRSAAAGRGGRAGRGRRGRPARATGRRARARWRRSSDLVARCIEAGRADPGLLGVSLGGFDTHADEKADPGPAAGPAGHAPSPGSWTGMDRDPRGPKVVVVVYSEFGRRVRANASRGHRPRHRRAGVRRGPAGPRRLLRRRSPA